MFMQMSGLFSCLLSVEVSLAQNKEFEMKAYGGFEIGYKMVSPSSVVCFTRRMQLIHLAFRSNHAFPREP